MIRNWLIGSDIEVFLRDRVTGEFISSVNKIPGNKENPYWIDKEKGYAVETDNVSVEFLIPPSNTATEFIYHINYMMDYIRSMISRDWELVPQASARFSKKELDSPQAQLFGCDRDFNAWKMDYNPKPDNNTDLRSTGAHTHLGYEDPDPMTSIEFIKAFDLFLGLPSLLIDPDTERRKIYGKSSSCRFKSYGIEARILSSFFISNDELIEWWFNNTVRAIDFVNQNPNYQYKEDLESIINNNMKEEAIKLIDKYKIEMPKVEILI